MKLTILGSGTGTPMATRHPPGYLVQGEGWTMLMDCGSGTVWRLAELGHALVDLDYIAITHTHPDHIGDLLTLFHAFHLPGMARSKPLTLFGPEGIQDFLDAFVFLQTKKPQRFELQVQENPQALTMGPLTLDSAPMVHNPNMPALGYRLSCGGQSLVYSGDADPSEALVQLSAHADLAIYDCSTLAEGDFAGHMSAQQCGEVAQKAGVKTLILSHLYPLIHNRPDAARLPECRAVFSGEVVLAEDRMVMVSPF
ncbi:MBL fold metallo-hydrolase [Magnetococcus sp. PR-3]|uniref:MBL fold metallo-hydrolase n=1 Tax=Magnetococcus sp. PR-3 TaxID=3120355 RepID=UPI002FCE03AC